MAKALHNLIDINSIQVRNDGNSMPKDACYIMQGTERYRAKEKDFWTAKESPFLYLNNTPNLRKDITWKDNILVR
ncbi:hypothetical protein CN689_23705 [Peribacillus butanolivorans]|uniref:Uncharacterized protein n=1 Tax=Peribacillus butanolivorans TaxID=421767 RepID=A0AAX0RY67_9BACI|nr:hypothetical protein [Peribacillus butanolivorans]AXN41477.1 hypothetical protein DTO10_25990 [Peribacillus butanolivorans]KON69283.1 hypothetical protein AKG34_11250 [Peribacillus butanolivorans]PEJ27317.1 hypothetical protein CN689_23705 [Peribacillus butanolivorans]